MAAQQDAQLTCAHRRVRGAALLASLRDVRPLGGPRDEQLITASPRKGPLLDGPFTPGKAPHAWPGGPGRDALQEPEAAPGGRYPIPGQCAASGLTFSVAVLEDFSLALGAVKVQLQVRAV
jgi:hypothetical protein